MGVQIARRNVRTKSNYGPIYPHPYELFMLQFLRSAVKLSISKHSHDFPEVKNGAGQTMHDWLELCFFCGDFLGL